MIKINYALLLIATLLGLTACEETSSSTDKLFVRFYNNEASAYTISNIQLQDRGDMTETTVAANNWSENILPTGKTLAPGEYFEISLDIPNSHWSQYRLGVIDNNQELMLNNQDGYTMPECSISHWGSHERSVAATVAYDSGNDRIYLIAWSDWAGID